MILCLDDELAGVLEEHELVLRALALKQPLVDGTEQHVVLGN